MAIIAILASAALFGVLVLTVVTIPLQQAEARVSWDGCERKSNAYENTDGNCLKKRKR